MMMIILPPEKHLPTSGQHGPAPSGTAPPPAQPPPPPEKGETIPSQKKKKKKNKPEKVGLNQFLNLLCRFTFGRMLLKACSSLALLILASDAVLVLRGQCVLQGVRSGVQDVQRLPEPPVEQRRNKDDGCTSSPPVDIASGHTSAPGRGASTLPSTRAELGAVLQLSICPGGASDSVLQQKLSRPLRYQPPGRPLGRSCVPARLP